MSTHHETLGIEPGATPEEIKSAFRRAAMKAHPDRGGSAEAMQAVNDAFNALQPPDDEAAWKVAKDALLTVIGQGVLGDSIVTAARRAILAHLRELDDRHRIMSAGVAALQRGLGTVQLEADPSLIDLLLQDRIDQADAAIADNERHAALSRRALELLA